MTLAAVLVAAGRSRRMGSDKLWLDLFGRPVWRWSLDTLLAVPILERLALVVPSGSEDRFGSLIPSFPDRCAVVAGAETRGGSVRAGLSALTDAGFGPSTLVLVHDAARPGVTLELVQRLLDAAGDQGGAVPALPVSDTLLGADGRPVDRSGVLAVQTPQLGRLGELATAVDAGHFTDEGTALLAAGVEVRTVAGDPANRKLTVPEDLEFLRGALRGRAAPVAGGGRFGVGFDAHRFDASRPLRLGGLDWPGEPGLAGHSDGDAALHAVIDALLGAAGLGDIGSLFPADERWRNADSAALLRGALAEVAQSGWRPSSVDLTIVAAGPPVAPRRAELIERLSSLLGIPGDAVSVKGTTSDGLGLAGGEGIAAFAVASIERL